MCKPELIFLARIEKLVAIKELDEEDFTLLASFKSKLESDRWYDWLTITSMTRGIVAMEKKYAKKYAKKG